MGTSRATIGYLNEVLEAEWATLPWMGARIAAENRNVNLISFHGNGE
jgi:hypothetical protein